MNQKPILINIVSGKGGTGKSLTTAVLGRLLAQEGASVLLVDLDIFVRGLTHFFYLYKKERRRITVNTTAADWFGLSDRKSDSLEIAKERFFEVDLLPAVSEIEEELNYSEGRCFNPELIDKLFQQLRMTEYDIILLDNRAGIDDFILSCCHLSSISISVSESDPVSRTTNDNLLRHLKRSRTPKVYTLLNKVRYLRTLDDYKSAIEQIQSDYEIIGQVPFDVDLFEIFGRPGFWDQANSTKYAYGIAEAWNKLAHREEIPTFVDLKRFPEHKIWPISSQAGIFANRFERMSVSAGFLFLISYLIFDKVLMSGRTYWVDLLLVYSIGLIALPFFRHLVWNPELLARKKISNKKKE